MLLVPAAVSLLLPMKQGAATPPRKDLNAALLVAAKKGDFPAAKTLLEKGADANTRDERKATALMLVASSGNRDLVTLLLDRGADVKAADDEGDQALYWAVNAEIVHLLHSRGADVNARNADGETVLMRIVGRHSPTLVKALLAEGADPKRKDRDGVTALIRTASWTQYDMVVGGEEEACAEIARMLVSAGAEVNAQDREGMTALMRAASGDHSKTVLALLECGADVNLRDRRGRTALTWAARSGKDNEDVLALIKKGAQVGVLPALLMGDREAARTALTQSADLNARGPYGEMALMVAAEKGDADLVRALLAKGADPNAHEDESDESEAYRQRSLHSNRSPARRENVGVTALHLALAGRADYAIPSGSLSWSGDPKEPARLQIVKALLEGGADVNARDEDGRTALLLAVVVSPIEVVRTLLDRGADLHVLAPPLFEGASPLVFAKRATALTIAAGVKRPEIVRELLASGADPNARNPGDVTALIAAAGTDAPESVRLLLAKGADANAKMQNGQTALLEAAGGNERETVRLLLDHGGDPNAGDEQGLTPLMEAANSRNLDILEMLLARGARVQAMDKGGATALTYAAQRNHSAPLVQVLIRHGAPPRLIDALLLDDRNLAQRLLAAGADPNVHAPDGRTALMVAAAHAQAAIVKALLEKGAKVNVRDRSDRTALMWAVGGETMGFSHSLTVDRLQEPGVEARVLATLQLLTGRGADIQARSKGFPGGATALMIAAANTNRAIVKILLDHGANLHVKDRDGKTALKWAQEKKHVDIIALLKQAGATE